MVKENAIFIARKHNAAAVRRKQAKRRVEADFRYSLQYFTPQRALANRGQLKLHRTYTYLANSPLVSQISFKSNGVTRMTTTKSYDFLNPVRYASGGGAVRRVSRGCQDGLPLVSAISHGVSRVTQLFSVRFWLCVFAVCAVIGLAGCVHTWPTKPAAEEAAGQLGPATFETNMIGKTTQVVGIPKSIKAYHWIETDRGSVQVDTAWPPELLSAVQTNKIVIAAKLDFEKGKPGGKLPVGPGVSVQSGDTPGEWIPYQFILRDVRVLQILYPTNRTQ